MSGSDKGDGGPVTYTPYLKIRYELADLDQTRSALPAATDWWSSPDITFSPADMLGNARAGVPTTVQCLVFNWGAQAAVGTAVDFFWMAPSLGMTSATAQKINTSPVLVTVPSLNYVTVSCPTPWLPTAVSDGHECLIVQASCPSDPLMNPMRPDLDRHVGQRNLSVVAPGQLIRIRFRIPNPFGEHFRFALQHSAVAVRGELDALPREAAIALMTSTQDSVNSPRMSRADISDQVGVRLVGREEQRPVSVADNVAERASLLTRLRSAPDRMQTSSLPLADIHLREYGSVLVTVQIMSAATAETSVVHRFSQVADGIEIGGYDVIEPAHHLVERWSDGAAYASARSGRARGVKHARPAESRS